MSRATAGSKRLSSNCKSLMCCSLSSEVVNKFPQIRCRATTISCNQKEKNLELYQDLAAQRLRVISACERKAGRDKLSVRERLMLLADEGSEVLEIGLLCGLGLPYGDVPCAGNAVCLVDVCGEKCIVSANDWTVKGGSSFPITLKKQLRAQEIARHNHLPCIYLVDSGGAYLPLQVSSIVLVTLYVASHR